MNGRKRLSALVMALTIWMPAFGRGIGFRGWLFARLIQNCGKNLKVAALANIYNPSKLTVGDNVYIGFCSYIGDGEIELGDEVVIGPYVSITGGNHMFKEGSVRFGGYSYAPVKIGRGTWIGGHACVLAGVTIGSGCLVAAGSVVTQDIPDNTIVGGVPAKKIKDNDPNSGSESVNQLGFPTNH